MGLFDGKVVIVTGAGGGIGREYALLFAREGAQVVVNDLGVARDGSQAGVPMADAVVAEIRAAGGTAVADRHSVADADGAEGIVATALEAFGRVDVLVNNAGILRDRTILKMTDEEWDVVQAVHLRGSFLCLRAAARVMAQLGGGAIVNTSSTSGLLGNFGQANYGAAKEGVVGLTRVAALEFAKAGIRVNAIAPVAKTRMTEELASVAADLGPEWIAPLVVFLASDLARGVTGRVFFAERGRVCEFFYETSAGVERQDRPWTPRELADRWSEVVRRQAGPAAMSPADLEALVLRGLPGGLDAAKAAGWNARFHLNLLDADGYTVVVTNGRCRAERGLHGQPTCVLTGDAATLYGVFRGEIDGTQAYMKGKLKVSNVGDIAKFTSAYDAVRAREAQAHAATEVLTAEDLTPRGVNRAVAGATFRGTATLAAPTRMDAWARALGLSGAPEDQLLSSFPLSVVAPLVGQAVSALAGLDVERRVATAGVEIESIEPIVSRDLLYPVLSLRAVQEHVTHDAVVADVEILREGEVVQRITWTGHVTDTEPAPVDEATTPGATEAGALAGIASAVVRPLAALARELVQLPQQDGPWRLRYQPPTDGSPRGSMQVWAREAGVEAPAGG